MQNATHLGLRYSPTLADSRSPSEVFGPHLAFGGPIMHPSLSIVLITTQAAAEYAAASARNATSESWRSLQDVLDGARDYVSDHTLIVVLGGVVLFALLRFAFTAPRVR